jgi:quinoprotein glucose dehydrogenase
MLYVKTSNTPAVARVVADAAAGYVLAERTSATFHNGLPLLKPPYGHMTAVNLNTGDIVWQVPFGDDAQLRKHPALKGVPLPEKLGVAGVQGTIVTKGGLLFAGGGDTALHALDKQTGEDLWMYPLPRRTTGTPMTYIAGGRQYVVIATGTGADATLVAFALP